jgi:sugar lactone lactonase YvrE
VILRTSDSYDEFGRFGDGFELMTDHGTFDRTFAHDLSDNARVFVRAWDASSFELAVAYGDSATYGIQRVADEQHDFGSWIAGTAPGYPSACFSTRNLRDINGDGIPDGWAIAYGLDPRNPVAPLDQVIRRVEASYSGTLSGALSGPRGVVVSDKFVFVADTDNDRIVVLNSELTTVLATYSGAGSIGGTLQRPRDIAYYKAGSRLVVADTDSYRIVLLDVNPSTGSLSYTGEFGSKGDANGQFDRPLAVAVLQSSGRIFVVDSDDINVNGCNHRIQRFSSSGTWELTFGGIGNGQDKLQWPQGITVADNGFVYVADTGNHRIKCMNSGGLVLWTYGSFGTGDGQFDKPRDVREGTPGWLYVADTGNNRIVLLDINNMPANLRYISAYGTSGSAYNQFRFPEGVYPIPNSSNLVYVADTLNNRIQAVSLIADADKDGMDDLWEYNYYSTIDYRDSNDWAEDPDGDGLINIGEYRAGTDPLVRDTNNNGAGDLV